MWNWFKKLLNLDKVEALREEAHGYLEALVEALEALEEAEDQINTLTAHINRIEREGWEADHIEMEKRRRVQREVKELLNGPSVEINTGWETDPVV